MQEELYFMNSQELLMSASLKFLYMKIKVKNLIKLFFLFMGNGILLLSFTPAQAQNRFPDKPINIIVPFAPGGGNDLVARLVTEPLGEILKQPVIVVNKTGAGGIPGSLTNQPPLPPEAPIVNQVQTQADGRARNLRAPGSVETGVAVSDDSNYRKEQTVNYEVDRAIEKLKSSKGKLLRVSAAVVLDNKFEKGAQPTDGRKLAYTPEEIQKINSLVKDAIGYVQTRGDTVSVMNLPFSEEPVVPPAIVNPDLISQLASYGAIALAVLFAYFAILRPLLWPKPKAPAEPKFIEPVMPEVSEAERMREEMQVQEETWAAQQDAQKAREERVEREIQEQMARMREREIASKAKIDELVTYAIKYSKEQPQDASLLLRAWVSEPQPANQERT